MAQRRWFTLSVLTLVVALLSPLDTLGDSYLFSAHMVQHLLLATVWPPLLLLGLPQKWVDSWLRAPAFGRGFLWLSAPVAAFLLFNGDISVWHVPALYDATLENEWIHILEHLTFMACGMLVWWPVLSPIRPLRLSYAAQELYLFANLFPGMALGIMFSFLQRPLYGPYIHAPRLWGISALSDQQIGGLIMWMPGNLPFVIAMVATLIIWLERGDPGEDWRAGARTSPAAETS